VSNLEQKDLSPAEAKPGGPESELSEERACPKCKASVTIADPAWAWVVTCQSCHSLLAVDGWKHAGAAQERRTEPQILPEARKASYAGQGWVIAGVVRMRDPEGYSWWEILLWSPASGERRWVTASDGHYLMELPLPQGEDLPNPKDLSPGARLAYAGLSLEVPAETPHHGERGTVEAIAGTIDYDLRPRDTFRDFEAYSPPFALSLRKWGKEDPEIGLERWLPPKHVRRWLPGVAEVSGWAKMEAHKAEPLWHTLSGRLLGRAAFLLGAILIVSMGLFGVGDGRVILGPTAISVADLVDEGEGGRTLSLKVDGSEDEPVLFNFAWTSKRIAPDNFWAHIQVMLLDAKEQVHYVGNLTGGHYSGVEGGESWREGSRRLSGRLTGLKPGDYKLALSAEVEMEPRGRRIPPSVVMLEIRRASWSKGGAYFVAALMLIISLLVPAARAIRRAGISSSDEED
jgi:hypothetical protein